MNSLFTDLPEYAWYVLQGPRSPFTHIQFRHPCCAKVDRVYEHCPTGILLGARVPDPCQIRAIIRHLSRNVVVLIKDLNGNHVVQKCLQRFSHHRNPKNQTRHQSSEDFTQFIYDAVEASCLQVATHRHGCCVLQRCIDHSSESQKVQVCCLRLFG